MPTTTTYSPCQCCSSSSSSSSSSGDCELCYNCCIPNTFVITVEAPSACAALNGVTVTVTKVVIDNEPRWRGETTTCGGATLKLELFCKGWTFPHLFIKHPCLVPNGYAELDGTIESCEPLHIVWASAEMNAIANCPSACCSAQAWITFIGTE